MDAENEFIITRVFNVPYDLAFQANDAHPGEALLVVRNTMMLKITSRV